MEYVSALVPPAVMAVAFTFLIRTLIKSQGGARKAKEDAVVDAALSVGKSPARRPGVEPGA
jgi:hypothetical protein